MTISVLDGSPDQRLAETRFPNAHIISAPSAGQPSKVLLDVITGKANIALTDPAVVNNFLKKNPKTLQQLGDGPAQIFPLVMILPKDNPDLKTFIDTGLSELINKGAVNDIFAHYPDIGSSILFVNRPYQRSITSDDTVNAIKKMDRDAAK